MVSEQLVFSSWGVVLFWVVLGPPAVGEIEGVTLRKGGIYRSITVDDEPGAAIPPQLHRAHKGNRADI